MVELDLDVDSTARLEFLDQHLHVGWDVDRLEFLDDQPDWVILVLQMLPDKQNFVVQRLSDLQNALASVRILLLSLRRFDFIRGETR